MCSLGKIKAELDSCGKYTDLLFNQAQQYIELKELIKVMNDRICNGDMWGDQWRLIKAHIDDK